MEGKKAINGGLVIIAVILAVSLLRHFDPKTMSFEKPWLDGIYFVTLLLTIYMLIRDYRRRPSDK